MIQFNVRKRKTSFLILFCLLVFLTNTFAQAPAISEIKVKKEHSAHKATIYSFILPGLGQAYNRKYWKVPIIYAGFGFLTYMIITNKTEYKAYKAAYEFEPVDENDLPPNDYYNQYSKEQLQNVRDYYRMNMELSYILSGFWYLLNVVDASVDANLFDFKVSPDLTLRLEPYIYNQPFTNKAIPGITMQIGVPGVFGFK